MENVIIMYLSIALDIVFRKEEFIQNYFKNFSIFLIWNKNLRYHTSWPAAKLLWIHPWWKLQGNES